MTMTKSEMAKIMKMESQKRLATIVDAMENGAELTASEMQKLVGDGFLSKQSLNQYMSCNQNSWGCLSDRRPGATNYIMNGADGHYGKTRYTEESGAVPYHGKITYCGSKTIEKRYVALDDNGDIIDGDVIVKRTYETVWGLK